VHQPSVLLLDEPWSGLDAASAERLERIVTEERERQTIVIVVSHTAGHAERFGARRIRIEDGRIVRAVTS
jgi:ABC-type multidrug transport system ATPase subunit